MIVSHAPGLLPEQWDENAVGVYAGKHARYVQAHVNLASGFIFAIYEAATQDLVIEQLEELGLPFDEIHEVQFSQSYDQMKQRLTQQGRI